MAVMHRSKDSYSTVKHVLNGHSKTDKTNILMTNGSPMKVKSIAECSTGFTVLSDNIRIGKFLHVVVNGITCLVINTYLLLASYTPIPHRPRIPRIDKYFDSWLKRTQFVKILTESHSPKTLLAVRRSIGNSAKSFDRFKT